MMSVWGSFNHGPCINPKLYVKYVNVVFAVFVSKTPFNSFLEYLNGKYPNIKFTEDFDPPPTPFLDTEIKINNDTFESWAYRKNTQKIHWFLFKLSSSVPSKLLK